ncbi:MAG: hypothetical protein K9H64_22990 [Bacteroidales bacterium]|nr:hypothetical protein [Bacteroidales bacterium]
MRRNFIIIIGILFLTSCKEEISKFLFDASKMSTQTKYSYKYDSERIVSEKEVTYTIMYGQVVDSIVSNTAYEYNDKGLLTKKTSPSEDGGKLYVKVFEYNSNDSLIRELRINRYDDTISQFEYKYYPDGRKTTFHRYLFQKFPSFQSRDMDSLKAAIENPTYDTSGFRKEYEYNGEKCKILCEFDLDHKPKRMIKYEYADCRLIKETHFIYFESMELLEKTKYYDYSKSSISPDFYTLDAQNDTMEVRQNEFNKEEVISTTDIHDYGNMVNKTFYENGNRIGYIGIDKNMGFKVVQAIKYYKSGDLKEIRDYNQKIDLN